MVGRYRRALVIPAQAGTQSSICRGRPTSLSTSEGLRWEGAPHESPEPPNNFLDNWTPKEELALPLLRCYIPMRSMRIGLFIVGLEW